MSKIGCWSTFELQNYFLLEEIWLILMITLMICFLLVHYLDDVINMAFQKTENNKNCIIFVLNYITQKRNIIKMIKVKFKIILNDKICI